MAKQKINLVKPIQEGIERIVENHPVFSGHEEFIRKHIISGVLKDRVYELYEEAKSRGLEDRKMQEYLHRGISDYVAAGLALDKPGRRFILGKGLEERTGRGVPWFFARRQNRGEKYFDKILGAGRKVDHAVRYNELKKRRPKIAESVETLYDFDFLNDLIDNMRKDRIINLWEYHQLKRIAKERRKAGYEQFKEYLAPRKIAASVLMVLGVLAV